MKYFGAMVSDRHMSSSDLAYVYQKVEKTSNIAECWFNIERENYSYPVNHVLAPFQTIQWVFIWSKRRFIK
jgi:hypothetical protein